VKDKPILFSVHMVLALLDDVKSMTRRVIDPQPVNGVCGKKPPYQVGDTVWVRETWRVLAANDDRHILAIQYFADGGIQEITFTAERYEKFRKYAFKNGWQSPYFMPKEAARIHRAIAAMREERLQDMPHDDAAKEGIRAYEDDGMTGFCWSEGVFNIYDMPKNPTRAFAFLWNGLNKKRGFDWDSNPWVWAYTMTKEGA
jgi:hypothetical protein